MSKSNKKPTECKVCSGEAFNTYYGVKACEPCKVFFKRNAENRKKIFKCDFDDQCEINVINRHVCSACRLKKCFDVGMCAGMIRAPQVTQRKKRITKFENLAQLNNEENIPSIRLKPTNLLNRDISSLNHDQWILLSNLIHLYDNNNALPIAKSHSNQLDSLHPKLRFKIDSDKVMSIVGVIYQMTEPFLHSNRSLDLLPPDDRLIVLNGACDNVTCFNGGFVLRDSGLITNLAFQQGLEATFGTIPYQLTVKQAGQLGEDIILIKLSLSLVAFCMSNCTVYDKDATVMNIRDYRTYLNIQNTYVELIWRYLIYKYSFREAVIRYNNLIQCFIVQLTIRTHLQEVKNHTDAVDVLVQNIQNQHQMSIYND